MTKRGTHEDNYHKLSVETEAARRECGLAYAVWNNACARLHRLERQLNDAWREVSGLRADGEKADKT